MNKTNQNKLKDKIYYIEGHLKTVLELLNDNSELENGILITQFEKMQLLTEDIKYYFNSNYSEEFIIKSDLLLQAQSGSFHIPNKDMINLDRWDKKGIINKVDFVKIMCVKCEKDISHTNHIMMAHNINFDLHIGICQKCYNKYLKLVK